MIDLHIHICASSAPQSFGLPAGEAAGIVEQLRTHTLNIQIRNHLLFNTLNSIASLAVRDGSMDTYRAIIDLAELLRGLLRREGARVPLSEEIAFLQRYINLQTLRFEDGLVTDYGCGGCGDAAAFLYSLPGILVVAAVGLALIILPGRLSEDKKAAPKAPQPVEPAASPDGPPRPARAPRDRYTPRH